VGWKNRALLVVFLLLWIVAAPLWAAEDSPAGDDEGQDGSEHDLVEYIEVTDVSLPSMNTIVTKLDIPLQLTPANVGTVGEALIYEQNALVLGDALQNVSGLNIQSGSGVHEYFTIRGFDSISSGLVMTDGIAEPEVSFYSTYNVRGVEVFKGPAGFLYGKNPLAGAVNIVRKQPLAGNFVVFDGSVGSFGSHRGTLDWNRSSGGGDVSFRLNGLWQKSDHYRDDKDGEQVAINPSLTVQLSERSKINFNFEQVAADHSPDAGLPIYLFTYTLPDVRRRNSYQSAGDFSEQDLSRFQIDFESRLNDTVTLRNKTYYRRLDWQSTGTLLSGVTPGFDQVIRDLALLDDRQEIIGNQFEAVFDLEGGKVEHTLLVGLEIIRETDEYTFDIEPLEDVNLLTLDPVAPDQGAGPLEPAVGDVTNETIAPYVIDHMKFSERFQLVLGARYDNIDVDATSRPLLPFPLEPTSFSRDDSEVSPMLGIVVAPDPSFSIYANAAESYAPPSTRQVDVFDPADREPQRGRQIELGVKKQFMDGRVRTTFAAYNLERDRIPITDATGFTTRSGDQRSRGLEVEVAAEPRPRLRTFFSYAYNDAELTEFMPCVIVGPGPCDDMNFDYSGNTPKMAPEHLANLWVSKSFEGGFGVAGGVRYVDEQFISEDNQYAIDSSVVVDAAFFYDRQAWRFKLNLKNVTDEEYELRGIAGASSVIPADPFAVYAGIEFRVR